jgi:hypothetical protein
MRLSVVLSCSPRPSATASADLLAAVNIWADHHGIRVLEQADPVENRRVRLRHTRPHWTAQVER